MSAAIRGVLLDVDGTLVDSNDAHARSWVDTFAEFGRAIPYEAVRSRIGEGGDKLLPQLTGLDDDSDEARAMRARRWTIFRERYLPTLRATPGASALVQHMRAAGLTLVVATSGNEKEVHAILDQAGLGDLLPHRTSADDAERSKPDPDIIHAALARGKLDAAATILIGDTPYDVAAGRKAGVPVVGVRCGGWDDAALAGTVAVYRDPAEILARWRETPLAPRATSGAA